MKKSKISKLIEIIFKLMLIGGTICLFILPKLYNLFSIEGTPDFNNQTILYQITFYLCYIICLLIIFFLAKIFNHIYQDSPFTKLIEKTLKIIAILFMSLSLIVFIKTIFIPTIISLAVVLITFIVSLCFYVLSQIFKIAIIHKDELDYTI